MKQLLQAGEDLLSQSEIAESKIDAWYLMEFCFHLDRVSFWLNQAKLVEEEEVKQYLGLIKLRCEHIPLQYITGNQEFMGLMFHVNEHVLIPRQDTECLVEKVMTCSKNKKILDMCTGSGCIAISLQKLGQARETCGVDISEDALMVAKENAIANEVEVNWIKSDLFAFVPEKYDIIVSNPPYIESKVIKELMPEVRLHEPMQALDGKENGLFFYQAIIEQAKTYLNKDGRIFFEIGYNQGEDVKKILEKADFTDIDIIKDLCGLDRVVCGKS
ncbi:MAG: peptide chain release factor N(5)-glutamine methyltransferase [Velocimicrobium sp.]